MKYKFKISITTSTVQPPNWASAVMAEYKKGMLKNIIDKHDNAVDAESVPSLSKDDLFAIIYSLADLYAFAEGKEKTGLIKTFEYALNDYCAQLESKGKTFQLNYAINLLKSQPGVRVDENEESTTSRFCNKSASKVPQIPGF